MSFLKKISSPAQNSFHIFKYFYFFKYFEFVNSKIVDFEIRWGPNPSNFGEFW
jgi:hypothetical protein